MVVFDPELAARMKMPKELLERAEELHFAMHIGTRHVYAALYENASFTCLWSVSAEVPAGISVFKFIYQRNWIEAVFRRCSVTFDTDCYALIPSSLFDPQACADYLHMQHGVMSQQTGYVDLPEVEAALCFELPEWNTELLKYFPNARIVPLSALIIRAAIGGKQTGPSDFVLVHSSSSVTIAAIKNRSLVLLSTHEARAEEDVLYHLSNAAMRLQIDLDNCSLQLLNMSETPDLLTLLQRYTKHASKLDIHSNSDHGASTQLHYLCA
jgi:hypothetical protein